MDLINMTQTVIVEINDDMFLKVTPLRRGRSVLKRFTT